MLDLSSRLSTRAAQSGVRPVSPQLRVLGSALLCAAVLAVGMLGAGRAGAISFRLTELSQCPIVFGVVSCFGSPITIGFRVEGDPGEQVHGLGLSAHGYDESVVDFTSGSAVSSIFHALAHPAIGAYGGLSNVLVPRPTPGVVAGGPLAESAILAYGNRVQFFSGVGCCPTSGNPLDPGLDGVVGGGDAQFRLTFTVVGPGAVSILFGAGYFGDGVVIPGGYLEKPDGLRLTIGMDGQPIVTPEPGAAVLIGLGLALLARVRTRPVDPGSQWES